jgi:CheY-like chemotaxis protein
MEAGIESLKRQILVIEDEPKQQEIYHHALTLAGYHAVVRSEAEASLRWLEQILPDLVVLDFMLPDGTGADLLREIRRHPQGEDLPVIVVTGTPGLAAEAIEKGAVRCILEKPVLLDALIREIDLAFEESSAAYR